MYLSALLPVGVWLLIYCCVRVSVCVCSHFLWTKYLEKFWTDFDEIFLEGWDQGPTD